MSTVDSTTPVNAADVNRLVAIACIEMGWHVVPWAYERDNKKPMLKGWNRGRALKTRADVVNWWISSAHRHHYAGIVCGPDSGLVVLDIDPRHLGDVSLARLLEDHGPLPDTFIVQTPSGGWHHYFRHPDGCVIKRRTGQGAIRPGVDVLGINGYAAAPGTITPRGAYVPLSRPEIADMPAWLVELATAKPRVSRADSGAYDDAPSRSVDEWVEGAAEVPPGQQDDYLFRLLCSMRARNRDPREMCERGWEAASAFVLGDESDPWTERHVEDKVMWIIENYAPGSTRTDQAETMMKMWGWSL